MVLTSRQLNALHKGSVRVMMGLGVVGFTLSMVALRSLLLVKNADKPESGPAITPNSKTNESSEELKG